jgi:hypothetical protein
MTISEAMIHQKPNLPVGTPVTLREVAMGT